MKIAPTLRWHIDSKRFGSTMDALRNDSAQMRKELRALLAVARAASMVRDTVFPLKEQREWVALDRALARLDAVSGGQP